MKLLRFVAFAACVLAVSACGRSDNLPKTDAPGEKSTSSVGSGTSANPTKPPLQTGEAGAKAGDVAGGGTTTGARSTPPPK
jgi:hypothetical protein